MSDFEIHNFCSQYNVRKIMFYHVKVMLDLGFLSSPFVSPSIAAGQGQSKVKLNKPAACCSYKNTEEAQRSFGSGGVFILHSWKSFKTFFIVKPISPSPSSFSQHIRHFRLDDELILSSGKMEQLDILLPKLKEEGTSCLLCISTSINLIT